jgi:hypothetical protein
LKRTGIFIASRRSPLARRIADEHGPAYSGWVRLRGKVSPSEESFFEAR